MKIGEIWSKVKTNWMISAIVTGLIGLVLLLFPRSSLGFRYRLQLNNTVGVIDSDYFGADNEGHIAVKFRLELKEAPDGPTAYSFSAGSAPSAETFTRTD